MKSEPKKDLYCNYSWLHQLTQFSDTIITETGINMKLILLSRNEHFKQHLRTSKTKFKKISAEHLNDTKDYCLNLCKKRIDTNSAYHAIDYHVMFINHKIDHKSVIRYMNKMLIYITHSYYPKLHKKNDLYITNRDSRDALLAKWTLDLCNCLVDSMNSETQKEINND